MRYDPTKCKKTKFKERFWSKVRKTRSCWIWTAHRSPYGYGRSATGTGYQTDYSHRISYLIEKGPIPKNKFVCHKCDNPPCVNPEHLFLGTNAENMKDSAMKGRHPSKLTPHQVRQIRKIHSIGVLGYMNIGRIFNVGTATIENAIKKKTWKHVV